MYMSFARINNTLAYINAVTFESFLLLMKESEKLNLFLSFAQIVAKLKYQGPTLLVTLLLT